MVRGAILYRGWKDWTRRPQSRRYGVLGRILGRAALMNRPPPFRAEHIGSLLRPPALLQARLEHAAGRLGRAELAAVEDAAIRNVVRLQEDVGLHVVTDGEF